MKKIIFIVMLLSTYITSLYAGSGKAIIPSWFQNVNNTFIFRLSNITSSEVSVKITLYNFDGSLYTDVPGVISENTLYGEGFNTNPIGSFATLNANSTGYVQLLAINPSYTGYGLIEWKSDDNISVALIAHGLMHYIVGSTAARTMFPINNLKPF